MKYFYIICRDGQIIEIPFSEEAYKTATAELVKKGLMAIRPKGAKIPIIINSVDVSKILDEENYKQYVFNVKPKIYITDGVWKDGKERQVIRYEKWKQEEIDNVKRIQSNQIEYEPTQEERKRLEIVKSKIRQNLKRLSP